MDVDNIFEDRSLSDVEKAILSYVLKNIDEAIKIGVRGIATKNFTSSSAVMRLAKKLGYKGFSEMVYDFKIRIVNNNSNRIKMNRSFNTEDIFSYSQEELQELIEILKNKKIFISGEGYSSIIAKYFYTKLTTIGTMCLMHHWIEVETIIRNYKEEMNAIIIISKSGESRYGLKNAIKCKNSGIKVIAFTGNDSSSLANISDIMIHVNDNNPLDKENFKSNSFFAYCLIAFEEIIAEYHKKYTENN
ncbi:MurR/RpiR family transcriptional regulator [Clostridium sp. AL.422]|uniref:MurR/RpiR family transcriptional regulator n=1 Tax=Clostridium TaxID=1485 RepID=UPI00293DD940|nr:MULTISPECIES: MurR/RpiR family transcriptional regulator [unclassified Clostridium]MDV4151389.1 MurR/RpiR family transcriptional regulator [Clostridium sp. AL.422]